MLSIIDRAYYTYESGHLGQHQAVTVCFMFERNPQPISFYFLLRLEAVFTNSHDISKIKKKLHYKNNIIDGITPRLKS